MTNSSVTLCHHWSEQTGATATGFGVLTTRMPACPWCVIEQLHAAVKTAQELAATRLMEIERLQAECDRLLKRGDKAELELNSLKHYYTLAARNTPEPEKPL